MYWVTALPPSVDRSYNSCLFILYRYSKPPVFLPCHKSDTAMVTALLLWKRVISHTGLLKNIISDKDPNFTSSLLTILYRFFGIQDMIRRLCAYGLGFKDSDGFTHDWCALIPALELAYKISVHSSTGQTPAMLEKGWNTRLPEDTLGKDLIEIHPTASSFKIILDKLKHHAKKK
ncbi:hypothetical protein O181_131812 [Austropuccinia psidii MF-1]|uniref:Integrase catalytic domain-containing protein n=1 Tax=Austropuccinia psidii MF-1 TaxID=1389203 RepID=A0A9Q3L6C6_9BASI|nr:hypothetical protein [Austropuccinia psidii MF-1]